MKRYKIPGENRDLRVYAFFSRFLRLFAYVLYIALWFIGYAVYLQKPLSKPLEWWAMLVFAFGVALSGWFIFKLGKIITGRSYVGRICDERIKRTYGRGIARNGKQTLDYHTYVKYRLDGGKKRKKSIMLKLFDDGYDMYYSNGDTLIIFGGLNYPLCVESEQRGEHICTVCGVKSYDCRGDGKRCRCCGHTLIDLTLIGK